MPERRTDTRELRRFEPSDGIPGLDASRDDHSGIHSCPTGMKFGGQPREITVCERSRDVPAGVGGLGDLENHVSHRKSNSVLQKRPIQPGNREVLAGGAACYRMSVLPETFDDFLREKTDSTVGSTVILEVPLAVARNAITRDKGNPENREFRHTAVRDLNRFQTPGRTARKILREINWGGHEGR